MFISTGRQKIVDLITRHKSTIEGYKAFGKEYRQHVNTTDGIHTIAMDPFIKALVKISEQIHTM
eukprot:SAG22_NODE_20943_length_261_cov_0.888889_1_plen_63_part_10